MELSRTAREKRKKRELSKRREALIELLKFSTQLLTVLKALLDFCREMLL